VVTSVASFTKYYNNGLALSYNDARSHLDIGRRVVEGLKPGLAQLGSVWLPLPHILMIPTIGIDFFWHTGLAGALQSMISLAATVVLVYKILEILGVGMLGRITGVGVLLGNVNILYLQSTAMTELLLIALMTATVYYLLKWMKDQLAIDLIKVSFYVMLSTLVRYDGWFLFMICIGLVTAVTLVKHGYKTTEGIVILFGTLGAVGIAGWFLWNLLIFKDPFYFAFGPYSARAQQTQMEAAGELLTKGNMWLSLKTYTYALFYNSYTYIAILGMIGMVVSLFDKKIRPMVKLGSLALLTPFIFNVIALFFGHSVLFIPGVIGGGWFNVRYGVLMAPSIAIWVGYLLDRARGVRWVLLLTIFMVTFFAFNSQDAVTIDDATVGSSQKNVSEVSGWLKINAKNEKGFVLISAASHDAIIFSSGLPMKKFIHEGTGDYWKRATETPRLWARWIIMRTHDNNDQTWKLVSNTPNFLDYYDKVQSFPFADIYQLKTEWITDLNTEASLGKQK
jgi:hypothetical protein